MAPNIMYNIKDIAVLSSKNIIFYLITNFNLSNDVDTMDLDMVVILIGVSRDCLVSGGHLHEWRQFIGMRWMWSYLMVVYKRGSFVSL